jgi:chromatin modification-related protein VID21
LIATSRKRKLRELYAVADCDGPIPPNWVVVDIDHPPPAPAPSPAETQFLEKNDILQSVPNGIRIATSAPSSLALLTTLNRHRFFDESSLPTRRQLQPYTAKGYSNGRRGVISQTSDPTRLSAKASRDDGSGKSRGNTPAKESGVGTANGSPRATERSRRGRSAARAADNAPTGLRRTSSRSSQTKLPSGSDEILGSSIDETMADGTQSPPASQEEELETGSLGKERIRNKVESRPGSPGIDPRKALPFSAEDEANSTGPLINGSHEEGHKAITAHLPPPEIQEDHLRQVDEREVGNEAQQEKGVVSGSLSIKLPSTHNGRPLGDLMSSPGSTIDAHSATTPALHEASTDTSPDNEGPRYEADRPDDKEPDPETPPELAPTREEVLEKEEHDRLLKAQIELARSEILAGSPTTADAQLRLEEEQAAAASAGEAEREIPDSEKSGAESSQDASQQDTQPSQFDSQDMTHSASEIVQDIMDDEDDEVVGVPTPEDEKVPDSETVTKSPGTEVPPVGGDAMDVDSAAVDDGSKSDASKIISGAPATLDAPKETTDSSETPSVPQKDVLSASTSTPPRRTPSGPAPTPPTLERMTTRVSSGAMRHKSVSEILGEIPKPNTISTAERNMAAKPLADTESATESNPHSRATTPQSPASRMRTMVERAKEKERSKLSTVVFAKQPADRPSSKSALVPGNAKAQAQESGDYFMPLILSQVYNATRGVQPLEALLMSAHKTITTSNSYIPYQEHQSHKVLRRIHSLQSQDKWSFRQPKRSLEPNRPIAHWDELLKEAKWMRTDFREERKWKMAVARNLARACAEWKEADEDDRKLLRVKAIIPAAEPIQTQDDASSSAMDVNHPTPELESSAENDSQIEDFDEEPRASLLDAVAPTAMFSLGDDDVVFGLRRSPATDKLLEELPMYGIPLKVPQSELPTSEVDPDASWRKPALPLSKYVEGKIVLKDDGPPRKKSRYEYEQEDDDDDQVVFGNQGSNRVHLEPAMLDVALFNPENKHIRDRIHAGHQFRPPSENPMPLQSFFECRSSSQWTWAEDDELKTLVREYSYNWQLISSMLSTRSLFASSAERRTPWECFERWIHLEGLPADMQKTHYFRAYNNRLEAAQRNLLAQAAQLPPQANAAGAAITPVRRRTTTSVRVERRRNQKHLTLVDAMRKLAKKRETSLQKQQHAAGLAAMRKANEAPQPQGARHTPQDFSRLKHEREMQMMERIQRHQMQQEAAKRV